ncbi:MAG: glycosyltransferase family 2 protein [Synergistaceae bacterium]|nr:glycosyltransferase family 2 protein [Synergistaceae bacterium]
MSPRISVIVIGYNIEQYISQCLESVLAQDYNNFELIFVDDGSRDNTLQEAQKFSGDSRVKILHKENGGCVSARKAGVREAQGEYICFVDGDDWLNADMLSNLVNELTSHDERVDIVVSNFFFQNPDKTFYEAENYKGISICHQYEYLDLTITEKIWHSVFPRLYRREFIINADFFDYRPTAMAEDFVMNLCIALHKPVAAFSKTVNYYYRYNEKGATRRINELCLDLLKSLEYVEEYFHPRVHDKYNDLIQYLWLHNLQFILYSRNISNKSKIKAASFIREKLQGFRNNKYCLEPWNRTRLANKLLLIGYDKCPHLMYILEPVIILNRKFFSMFIRLKRVLHRYITSHV